MIDRIEISRSLANRNKILIAAIRVQCPVYIFHLSMEEQDRDPFYAVDWAIVHYIEQQPEPQIEYLSALIGMNTSVIKWRIKLLEDDCSIERNLNKSYAITTKGERKFFSSYKPEITTTRSLAIDGVSLDFLDDRIYQESRVVTLPFKPESNPHMPLLGRDDPHVTAIIHRLELMSPEEKERLNLDGTSHDYRLLDENAKCIEAKSIDDVYIVFSFDTVKCCWERETMFRNESIDFASISGSLNQYCFYLKNNRMFSNEGYSSANDCIAQLFPPEVFKFIRARYSTNIRITEEEYSIVTEPQKDAYYPLIINISERLFAQSDNKRQLLTDAINEEFAIGVHNGGLFIVKVTNAINKYVETFKAISAWIKEHGGIDYEFIKIHYRDEDNWRKDFLSLQCYEELEEIDNKLYIQE